MSDAAPEFPVPIVQALIDSLLGTTIVQSFLSGIYALIFFQAIVPLIRDGRRKIYTGVLILLFCMVMVNLATSWQILRDVVVTHDETRDTMGLEILAGPLAVPQAANATGCIAVFTADALLVWRCYVLWQRNKFLLAGFTLLLLGEVALIPILLVLNASIGPGQVSIVCLFFFISIGVTVLATALIIYRIFDVASRSKGPAARGRYQYTIEILVESGIMYSATLLIAGVILAVRGNNIANLPLTQAAAYWGGILTPITGIAPTLISSRIVSGTARDEKQWSQPVSVSLFKARGPTASTTVHVTTATKTFGAGSVTAQGDSIGLGSRKVSNDSETQLSFGPSESTRSEWHREKNYPSAV